MERSLNIGKLAIAGLALLFVIVVISGIAAIKPQLTPLSTDGLVDDSASSSSRTEAGNIADLTSKGLSDLQVDGLQYAFYTFATKQKLDIRSLSINLNSYKDTSGPTSNTTGISNGQFTFSLDGKSFTADISYSGLFDSHVVVKDASHTTSLFDGGSVDGSKL